MRYSLLLGAVSGLAAAIPAPAPSATDAMDFFDILDVPQPTAQGAPPGVITSSASAYVASTIVPVAAETVTAALEKRDDPVLQAICLTSKVCCALPTNDLLSRVTPKIDTIDSFTSDTGFANLANTAKTPTGYVPAFANQHAAIQSVGYRSVYTFKTYDVPSCAAYCTADKLCQGFNIYIERDPVVTPDDKFCPNPDSTAFTKCTLYGYPVASKGLTTVDQVQSGFHGVIAASNGYNKPPDAGPGVLTNFDPPSALLPGAIESTHYYLFEFYNTVSFDPSVCAAGCQRNTAYNAAHAKDSSYTACNMFNVYVLYVNGQAQGTTCAYFDQPVPDSAATNLGQYRGDTKITVGMSYTYKLTVQDPGHLKAQ